MGIGIGQLATTIGQLGAQNVLLLGSVYLWLFVCVLCFWILFVFLFAADVCTTAVQK